VSQTEFTYLFICLREVMPSQFVVSHRQQCYEPVNAFNCFANVLAARWTV